MVVDGGRGSPDNFSFGVKEGALNDIFFSRCTKYKHATGHILT